jgi:hypothetical protein
LPISLQDRELYQLFEYFSNAPIVNLVQYISATSTSVVLGNVANLPLPNFRLLIEQELLLVTAISGNTLTVVRGIENTVAVPHSAQTLAAVVITANALNQRFLNWTIKKEFTNIFPNNIFLGRLLLDTGGFIFYDNGTSWDGWETPYNNTTVPFDTITYTSSLFATTTTTTIDIAGGGTAFNIPVINDVPFSPEISGESVISFAYIFIGGGTDVGGGEILRVDGTGTYYQGLGVETIPSSLYTFPFPKNAYPSGTLITLLGFTEYIPTGFGGITTFKNSLPWIICNGIPNSSNYITIGVVDVITSNFIGIGIFNISGGYFLKVHRIVSGSIDPDTGDIGISVPIDPFAMKWFGFTFDPLDLIMKFYVSYDGGTPILFFTLTDPTWITTNLQFYGGPLGSGNTKFIKFGFSGDLPFG